MKKIICPLCAGLLALLSFNSCKNEAEIHETSFYPMNPNGKTWYADQDYDSIVFRSFDDWSIRTLQDWVNVSPAAGRYKPGTSPNNIIYLHFSPNTSDSVRSNRLLATAYDNIGYPLQQIPYLDIRQPIYRIVSAPNAKKKELIFVDTIQAKDVVIPISFQTYKENATLTCDANWVTLDNAPLAKGLTTLKLTCTANTTKQERKANFTLTSNGVTNTITYIQKGVVAP